MKAKQAKKRLAFVVQRYGLEVGGGAETHCRWIAERLSDKYEIHVLTTCAEDYISWSNKYPPGDDLVNNIKVTRFKVKRQRRLRRFSWLSADVFETEHTRKQELQWVKENGPYCPALVKYLKKDHHLFHGIIAYSFRYYTAYQTVTMLPGKTILVPTAEDDPALRLEIFKEIFPKVAGILYLTPEERELVLRFSPADKIPNRIIGSPIDPPASVDGERFRKNYNITEPFVLYIGRIDRNKGCEELFTYFTRLMDNAALDVHLVLAGTPALSIPEHPKIRHIGYIDDQDKYDALSACEFLILPSFYESLSIVILEAWVMGKATLVNGRCAVTKGQTIRSNGGLYYENYPEFRATVEFLLKNPQIRQRMGESGCAYIKENYNWQTIEDKIVSLIEEVLGR